MEGLRPGQLADVLVFKPADFKEKATYVESHQYSVGMKHLLANGQIALSYGKVTGGFYGRVLRDFDEQQSCPINETLSSRHLIAKLRARFTKKRPAAQCRSNLLTVWF